MNGHLGVLLPFESISVIYILLRNSPFTLYFEICSHRTEYMQYSLIFLLIFFKVLVESVTTLLLFSVLVFWLELCACAILAPPPRTEPTPPGLKGEGLTTGPPSKFLSFSLSGVESSPAGDLQSPILSFVPKTSWQTERRKEVQITQCGSQRGRPA